jgi:hypothetical protein
MRHVGKLLTGEKVKMYNGQIDEYQEEINGGNKPGFLGMNNIYVDGDFSNISIGPNSETADEADKKAPQKSFKEKLQKSFKETLQRWHKDFLSQQATESETKTNTSALIQTDATGWSSSGFNTMPSSTISVAS